MYIILYTRLHTKILFMCVYTQKLYICTHIYTQIDEELFHKFSICINIHKIKSPAPKAIMKG